MGMRRRVRVHYDNGNDFDNPILWVWTEGTGRIEAEFVPAGVDDYCIYYDIIINRSNFNFKFKDEKGRHVVWEDDKSSRFYNAGLGGEIWCKAGWHNIYPIRPEEPVGHINDVYKEIKELIPEDDFYLPQTDVSEFDTSSLLGAHKLKDGSLSFALFHPRAGRIYLAGSFNNFKTPYQCSNPKCLGKGKFIKLKLYRGFYDRPNIWWVRIPTEEIDKRIDRIEYKYYIQGGIGGVQRWAYDPYTRVYSDDYNLDNCVVVDPTKFEWTDQDWKTPKISELIIYELNVYGFTDGDSDIDVEEQSTFKGIIRRIEAGYFNRLGVNTLAFMPTSEAWSSFGLGYDPCSFMSVEKDFGSPDDFRKLVNTAHDHGLAVIIDQVFNHTSNQFNPLWNLIDDRTAQGGFYFSGSTKWGNRLATGKDEVDNMLIDSCKLFIKEYHVDGFRFDATHTDYLDHKLLYRLQEEIRNKEFKSDAIMIVENLPNQSDLNFDGYNGYAQWCDMFHDKIKALLREGIFRNWCDDSPDKLGDIFYFCKNQFAAHTNNVINYSESHDETSIKFEVETNNINNCDIKDRKARLAMMATITALGQPMIYMGQEFGVNRDANDIDINSEKPDSNCPQFKSREFNRWCQKLINLRKKYSMLRISGENPIEEKKFSWMIGPWLAKEKGYNKKVIGWRTKNAEGEIMVLFNFGQEEVNVNLEFSSIGSWVKLADINSINDLDKREDGQYNTLIVEDDSPVNFNLPIYSGFIYKKRDERS